MQDGTPFIELKICLEKPAELFALVNAFTAIGNQFNTYIAREHPNLAGEAQLHVKEIRKGSIIVELIPVILPLLETMDKALIVDDFVNRYGGKLGHYLVGEKDPEASKSDLNDFLGSVQVIAGDENGNSTISSAIYHETKTTKRAEVYFDTVSAKKAENCIEQHKTDLELIAYERHERVMMRFYQSNLKDPPLGSKRTGERGVIEKLSKKPLAIIYETTLAKERIKHETRDDLHNLYNKGFIVDCFVEMSNGKPAAYRVSHVHDIFMIDD